MQTALRLQSLAFTSVKTYLVALFFVIGNILLPQLVHLLPHGGLVWLPIYFFTLIGGYKYGWRVGLITAILSPVVNSILFGMPAPSVVPVIMMKSTLLALIAGFAAGYFRKANLTILIGVVISYQVLGTIGEWILCGDLMLACQDFRIGIPGMLFQILGGWALINLKIGKK